MFEPGARPNLIAGKNAEGTAVGVVCHCLTVVQVKLGQQTIHWRPSFLLAQVVHTRLPPEHDPQLRLTPNDVRAPHCQVMPHWAGVAQALSKHT
jgi:hypothetical protein